MKRLLHLALMGLTSLSLGAALAQVAPSLDPAPAGAVRSLRSYGKGGGHPRPRTPRLPRPTKRVDEWGNLKGAALRATGSACG